MKGADSAGTRVASAADEEQQRHDACRGCRFPRDSTLAPSFVAAAGALLHSPDCGTLPCLELTLAKDDLEQSEALIGTLVLSLAGESDRQCSRAGCYGSSSEGESPCETGAVDAPV
jgi:hypothetical protein